MPVTCPACDTPLEVTEKRLLGQLVAHQDLYCRPCGDHYILQMRLALLGGPRHAAEGNKWCPSCRQERPLTDFTINRDRHDGRCGHCKDCVNERRRGTRRSRRKQAV